MTEPLYRRLAIIGVGLIGGSVGLAARRHGLVDHIVGFSRSEATRRRALELGVVDEVADHLEEAVSGADLVYVASPVGTIGAVLEALSPALDLGCTVTDAGSVKTDICREGNRFFSASFVGGHPIAGSEQAGVEAADADLFSGRSYILTPVDADEELLARLVRFVRGLGAQPHFSTPEEHDALVGLTSHLPHLWASALTLGLAGAGNPEDFAFFSGGGLRDTTRIAAGDPTLWRDIFAANREAVLEGCEGAIQSLAALRRALENDDLDALTELLQRAHDFREALGQAVGGRWGIGGNEMNCGALRVAIDGPAGAGKSTVARAVAAELDYVFIDTGAMYRAVAYWSMQRNLTLGKDDQAIGELAGELHYDFQAVDDERHLFVDGQDMEAVVRLPEVGRLSSPVSAIPLVRENLVVAQRRMAAGGGVVMEGRDIGTVVLPEAEVKVFLTASPEERAHRRCRQLRDMGMEVSFEDILHEQNVRDQRDSSRAVAPLKKAADAVEIVSDGMTREKVVAQIVQLVQGRQHG